MATKKKEERIIIRPIEIERFTVRIVGDTPLIMHAWSEKAKREMLENQQEKDETIKRKRDPKNPVNDFIQSMYWLTEKPEVDCFMSEEECEKAFIEAIQNGAKFGFPVTAFKQAGNSAAYRQGWVSNQMGLRGAYFIEGDVGDFVEIHSDIPEIREDMVRVGNGKADIRYRGQFNNWHADLKISFNKHGVFSKSDILNIINAGGYICGAGEWRPERDGNFGRYHVATI